MKPCRIIIALVGIVVVAGVIWLLVKRKPSAPPKPLSQATPSATPQTAKTTPAPTSNAFPIPIISSAAKQLPGGPYAPADPRWAERTRKLKEDPQYEWKTPISFYGKVLDQNRQPISGVEVEMGWTDMSPSGSSMRTLMTDGEGHFFLTGEQGKALVVHSLKKSGYVEANATNPHGFEFAGFWEPTYYDPDPNNPVIFHMRKKGEPAPLAASDGKIVLNFGMPSSIPLPGASGVAFPIKVTVFENDGKTRTWKAQISVDGGGITPALEEFPFEAPKEGYQSSIDLNQESPRPPGWQDMDEGGWFYIKTDQGYGLLKLRQIRGKRTLHYEVLLNSEGGTNLEPAQP